MLVSYNTRPLLLRLLARLQNAGWLTPIVIDNSSSDGSAEAVAAEFPFVRLIRNRTNVGFARAANQGLVQAQTPYVVLLNPDTEATPELLASLVEYLEARPDVWAVAPRLIASNGTVQTLAAGFAPTPWRAARSSSVLALRAVATTLSPRCSAASAQMRPKPFDVPVMNQTLGAVGIGVSSSARRRSKRPMPGAPWRFGSCR